MQTLIKGGRIVDPGNFDGIADIFIEDGKIVKIQEGKGTHASPSATQGKESRTIDSGTYRYACPPQRARARI